MQVNHPRQVTGALPYGASFKSPSSVVVRAMQADGYRYARQYWLDHIALAHGAGSASEVLRGQVKLARLRQEFYNQ